ncbi:uncharacterized protein LOC114534613 isoform X2 [Dendronephthya gigantea]|nr:uncharacterized protein LOC114534613 isoform X2 [Dendronephthya gigantea]
MQRFVKYVASKLNIGVRNDAGDVIGQGAIVTFSEIAEIEILLSESATPGAFDKAVDAMEGPLPGGRTNTHLGLELADRYVVQKTGGYRDDDDVKHILMVITDGEQTKGRDYVPVKEAIKPFFDRNMEVFAVGVGLHIDEAKQEIRDMVRSDANAIFPTSYTDLVIQVNDSPLRFCSVCGTKREDCHPTLATCTDIELGKYECRCHKGYIGDGKTCFACECSGAQRVKVKVNIGQTNASVSWLEPKPTCPTTPNPNNTRHTRGQFPVGNYTIVYQYTHTTESKSFKIQCDVKIVVTGMTTE